MLKTFFITCSSLVTLYSYACLIRIFLTWIPQLEYSPPGRFFAAMCDPFLNWFSRFSFTRIGAVDFSPILALGFLSVGSMVFNTLAATGHITIGIILAGFLQVIWSFFSFFLILIIVLLAIRLIYDLFNRYGYSPFWSMLDRFLNHPVSWVTSFFNRTRKPMSYRLSIILTLVVTILLWAGLQYGVRYLTHLLYTLPI
jgi:YggT family protein